MKPRLTSSDVQAIQERILAHHQAQGMTRWASFGLSRPGRPDLAVVTCYSRDWSGSVSQELEPGEAAGPVFRQLERLAQQERTRAFFVNYGLPVPESLSATLTEIRGFPNRRHPWN